MGGKADGLGDGRAEGNGQIEGNGRMEWANRMRGDLRGNGNPECLRGDLSFLGELFDGLPGGARGTRVAWPDGLPTLVVIGCIGASKGWRSGVVEGRGVFLSGEFGSSGESRESVPALQRAIQASTC